MEFVPIKMNDHLKDLDLKCHSDLMTDITRRMSENISKKKEDQIIEALKKRGYTFQNKQQLYEFAKRCEIHIFEEKPHYKELWYNKELVCTWSDRMNFERVDCDFNVTMTVTVG